MVSSVLELVLSSISTLCSEKYIHLNIMEITREVCHLKDTIKQQDVFLVFSKRRLSSHVFRHSVEKPHNTYTTQLVSYIVFQSSYVIEATSKIVI